MSALEPDSTASYVFPHIRTALRAYWAHQRGKGASRAALGGLRGKGPGATECLRVGRVLKGLGLEPRDLATLRQYAFGQIARTEDRPTTSLVQKVERRMRKLKIVAEATPRLVTSRDKFSDYNGLSHDVVYVVQEQEDFI